MCGMLSKVNGIFNGPPVGLSRRLTTSKNELCTNGMYYNNVSLSDVFEWSSSACRYDSQACRKQEILKDDSSNLKPWQRRVPYPHTGCLAHVEVTECIGDGCVTCIAGILDHNEGCRMALLEWLPAIPLHEHVYEVALNQLANGARYFPFLSTLLDLDTYYLTQSNFNSGAQPVDVQQ